MGDARNRRGAWAVTALVAAVLTNVATGVLVRTSGELASGMALAGEPASAVHVTARPRSEAPRRLSETGLYAEGGSIDPRNRHFVPQYPLWTDGAEKSRWIRLPEGTTIDVSDVDAWRFPAGTTFWKEFAWEGRKVETRMIRVSADGAWTFASYAWNEDQSDAILVPEGGIRAAFEIAPGKRHAIPGTADCLACHASSPAGILGFTALQLSDDRDPLAPNAEPLRPDDVTLRSLIQDDRMRPRRPELAKRPPRIRERDPVARAALGYLSGNCGSCHNARSPLARLGFSLLHEAGAKARAAEPGLMTTAGTRSRYPVPGVSADSCVVVAPGAPEQSALLVRMQSRRAASQMPPLGTVIADSAAVELVRRWIAGIGVPDSATARSGRGRPRT